MYSIFDKILHSNLFCQIFDLNFLGNLMSWCCCSSISPGLGLKLLLAKFWMLVDDPLNRLQCRMQNQPHAYHKGCQYAATRNDWAKDGMRSKAYLHNFILNDHVFESLFDILIAKRYQLDSQAMSHCLPKRKLSVAQPVWDHPQLEDSSVPFNSEASARVSLQL